MDNEIKLYDTLKLALYGEYVKTLKRTIALHEYYEQHTDEIGTKEYKETFINRQLRINMFENFILTLDEIHRRVINGEPIT